MIFRIFCQNFALLTNYIFFGNFCSSTGDMAHTVISSTSSCQTTHIIKPLEESGRPAMCDMVAVICMFMALLGLHIHVDIVSGLLKGVYFTLLAVGEFNVVQVTLTVSQVLNGSYQVISGFCCHLVLHLRVTETNMFTCINNCFRIGIFQLQN